MGGSLGAEGYADALAEALKAALDEQPDRESLKARGRQFRPEIAVERYLGLMLGEAAPQIQETSSVLT